MCAERLLPLRSGKLVARDHDGDTAGDRILPNHVQTRFLPLSSPHQGSVFTHSHTHTLALTPGTLLGDYCNLAANSVLSFPNDGTTEQKYARLSSATFMGETQEQCHVTGMKYPAQYHDTARNRVIKADAQH